MNSNCLISTYAKNRGGYANSRMKGIKVLHHRLVYCLSRNIELDAIAGLVVRHACDNPGCINPDHLELGSQQDNVRDRESRNRGANHIGTAHPRAKFKDSDIVAIRNMPGTDLEISIKYCVSKSTITKIRARINWSHIA